MREFFKDTFTGGLMNGTGFLVTLVSVIVALFLEAGQDVLIRALTCLIVTFIYLVCVLGVRAYQFYMTYARRIKVLRQVEGEGPRKGKNYLCIENPGFFRDNLLLTLYSPKSGADQSVCILQIDKAVPGEDILARPFPDTLANTDLSAHFERDNTTRLYVNPMIHLDDLMAMIGGFQVGEPLALPDEIVEDQNG